MLAMAMAGGGNQGPFGGCLVDVTSYQFLVRVSY
jgi:hypothetical protein